MQPSKRTLPSVSSWAREHHHLQRDLTSMSTTTNERSRWGSRENKLRALLIGCLVSSVIGRRLPGRASSPCPIGAGPSIPPSLRKPSSLRDLHFGVGRLLCYSAIGCVRFAPTCSSLAPGESVSTLGLRPGVLPACDARPAHHRRRQVCQLFPVLGAARRACRT